MRRILYALSASALVLAAAWALASLPGRVSADIDGTTIEASTSIAASALLLAVLLLYVVFRTLATLLRLPRFGSLWRTGRRRQAGDLAVTRALVALAAGEKADARREAGRARSLLGDTPQTLLLAAEAGRLAGRDDEASAALRALADRKDSAFLGLRGLMARAVTQENWAEAADIAKRAEIAHPGAAWLRTERSQLAIRAGHWADALALAGPEAPLAALAVGAAQAERDPDRAVRLAKQALKHDPAFTPAVLAHATQLRALGREKKAQAVLADGWKRGPHPDIAAMAMAPETDKLARARAAERLTAALPDHPETHLLLARASLEAGLIGEARRHEAAARAQGLNQRRAWLLKAEIEEEDGGATEAGRLAQRDALRRAAEAEPDPVWRCTACFTPQPAWRAACPVCQTPGSMRWSAEAVAGTRVISAAS